MTVYAIHAPSVGLVKIGYTQGDPTIRLDYIQVTSPVPLVLYGSAPGDIRVERDIHEYLAVFRRHNEWFSDQALNDQPFETLVSDIVAHFDRIRPRFTYTEKPKTRISKFDVKHGMHAMYQRGCRCAECKENNKLFMRTFRKNHPESVKRTKDRKLVKLQATAPHNPGKVSWYLTGCRCPGCRLLANQARYKTRAKTGR